MTTEDMIGLLIPLTWLPTRAWEALAAAHVWLAIRWWRSKSLAFFVVMMGARRNPREFRGEMGFEGGPITPIAPMLIGRDANPA